MGTTDGKIAGVVQTNGTRVASNTLRAYTRTDGVLRATGTSNASGNYIITGIDTSLSYWVVAVSGNSSYNSLIADRVTPANTVENASLVCNFNGTHSQATTTDDGYHAISMSLANGAILSTASSKFGASSLAMTGTTLGPACWVPYSATPWPFVNLRSEDFTVEAFVYLLGAGGGTENTIANMAGGFNIAWPSWRATVNASQQFFFQVSAANTGVEVSMVGTQTVPYNQWVHLAVSRAGDVYRTFVDGTLTLSSTSTHRPYQVTARGLTIGMEPKDVWAPGTVARCGSNLNGYMDGFVIVHGVALYTANFTPRASPYALP